MGINKFSVDLSEDTPSVNFDPKTGEFDVEGMSRPEDVTKFYNPVIDWLEKYAKSPAPATTVNFRYSYFNTASARKIYEILAVLDDINLKKYSKVNINWYYDEPDIDMKMAGEEYDELIDIDINHCSVSIS